MRDHNCFLSVVVPVYNTEKYLKRCLDSALESSIDNMQIILVDDGSTDGSPAICDQYAALHKNITVMHRENSGVSATRNAALRAATGRYIFFLDSDDAVQQGIFAKFHDCICVIIFKSDIYINCADFKFFGIKIFHGIECFKQNKAVFAAGYCNCYTVAGFYHVIFLYCLSCKTQNFFHK